jgi:DNA-binding response OmpR family regulator
MHALIIEDEPLIAMLIEDHLRASGYTSVAFAGTEAEALAAARCRCPDLITADMRLPQGCGIAAVEAICGGRPIPVIFITATAWEVRHRLRDAVIVAKPFGSAHLNAAIAAATGAEPGPLASPTLVARPT